MTATERPLASGEVNVGASPVERRRVGPPAVLVFAGILAVCAATLLYAGRDLTFFYDEWDWVAHRYSGGFSSLLEPHNEHLSLVPLLVYRALFTVVGLDSYWVYRGALVVLHLTIGVLVFALARRRVGDAGAAAAATLILFLGRAWEDLLWAFQIGFLGSVAAGLAVLLALDRDDRRGDVTAGVLLGVALGSSSLGVPIAAGVAAELVWSRRWRRLAVVAAPLALYGLWYLGYGNSALKRDNILVAPEWALDAAAGAVGALAGQGLEWGRPLLVVALVAFGFALAGPRRISPRLVGVVSAAAAFWLLTGAARNGISAPDSPRYLYPGAVLLVLAACELLRGSPPAGRQVAVVAGAVALAVSLGAADLRAGARFLRSTSDAVRAELGAAELLGARADPAYQVDTKLVPQLTIGPYLKAVTDIGSSPAYSPAELARAGGTAREQADRVLIDAGGIRLGPARHGPRALLTIDGAPTGRLGCLRAKGPLEFAVPRGVGVTIRAIGGPVAVRARRFLETFNAPPVGVVPAGARRTVVLARDRSSVPWHLRLEANGAARACGLRGGS